MYASAYVWAKIIGYLEERLTPVVVSTTFEDTEVVDFTDEALILYSPSEFHRTNILTTAHRHGRRPAAAAQRSDQPAYRRRHQPEFLL